MAFEQVNTSKYIKSNSLKVGESIEGYVVGKYNSTQYPEIDSLKMVVNGETIVLNPHGALKYFFKNGNSTGYYYRFTRLEDMKTKKGAMSAQWKIEVDKSKVLDQIVPGSDETKETPSADLPF